MVEKSEIEPTAFSYSLSGILNWYPTHVLAVTVACCDSGFSHVGNVVLSHGEVFGAQRNVVLEITFIFIERIVLVDVFPHRARWRDDWYNASPASSLEREVAPRYRCSACNVRVSTIVAHRSHIRGRSGSCRRQGR